ncbi:hypothetical protein [Nannocystis punicea]|uniref:Uncharacterized protein n=1 Tax=Nannocystis punicea TaxID=2995304 RepID=A0ABY7GV07_9BACT|nr:hypothetical protein [Nannocystis poenicansa]WAS90773.1 hypothetical protein O0S08_31685 [Nannocystis poenicansa]
MRTYESPIDRLLRPGLSQAWPSDTRRRVAVGTATTLFATLGEEGEIVPRVYSGDTAVFSRIGDAARDMLGARGGARPKSDMR